MSNAEAAFIIIGGAAPVLGGIASLLRMVYRRGLATGEEKARREVEQRAQAEAQAKIIGLEKLVGELQAELASIQPRRRRA
jgi:predicted ATPase